MASPFGPVRWVLVCSLIASVGACQNPRSTGERPIGDRPPPQVPISSHAPAARDDGVEMVSQAHTTAPTGHQCCTWEIEHCTMGGVRPGLPASCNAGHRTTDVSCGVGCCLLNIFTDPCPGFIIGGECSRAFETSTAADGDGDGLNDSVETCGLDTNFDGNYDLDLPAMGANPAHKDLFLELDSMPGQAPRRADIQAMKAAFAAAPLNAGGVNNPDGLAGINLWVDTGTLSDATAREDGGAANSCGDTIDNGGDGAADGADSDCLVGDNLGGGNLMTTSPICDVDATTFDAAKNANFAVGRRRVFRYGISALGCDADMDGNIDSGGWGEIGGNDFIEYNHDGGTIMHELGHTLNLRHGGNVDANCKPNYVSVMNYDQQFGIPQAGGGTTLDYSPPRFLGGRGVAPLPQLRENALNENTILDATDATNRFIFVNTAGNKIQAALNLNPNYNNDTDPPRETSLTANIDTVGTTGAPANCANNASSSTLNGFDDWTNIRLDFKPFPASADGQFTPDPEPHPTLRELKALQVEINTTDLAVSGAAAPTPAVAGLEVVYTIGIENLGGNPADVVALELDLPMGATLVSAPGGCGSRPGGLACSQATLLAGTAGSFAVRLLVAPDFVFQGGTALALAARVSHGAGPDSALANNQTVISVPVVAIADLLLRDLGAVSPPSQVIVGQPVTLAFALTADNLGPSSPAEARVESVIVAPAGTQVLSPPPSQTLPALAVGAPAAVAVNAEIVCDEPGPHVFSLVNRISHVRPAHSDPIATNDEVSTTVSVECVVPVRINIHPNGNPNPINLRGQAPVAVLTTAAGEYGLPLAFNAVRIVATSVRFGTEAETFGETGGAFEVHGRGHPEDSFELDELTRDGDQDLVLHFRSGETSIASGVTEACVKGVYLDAGGVARRFFGCDSIVVRPR